MFPSTIPMAEFPDGGNSTSGEMKRFVYVNDGHHTQRIYCNNRIKNTKYTLISFLPKNLWEQFSRFMNKYFLLIACLQLWPLITPVNPVSTWGPLIFIFLVSATKEAWDDYGRYIVDKKGNERIFWILKKGVRTQIQAQNIRVGDVLWLRERDEAPCDIVLLGTSEPDGTCYVETAAMDGESNLKTRVAPAPCIGLPEDLLYKIKGVIECRPPDNDIRRFEGNLRLFPPFTDNDVCALSINNTLLQSCFLRNTDWVCGVAVYTGNETKLGMSKGLPEPKLTCVDGMIDKLTGAIFVFQLVVVIILGVAGNAWKSSEAVKLWYVRYSPNPPWYDFVVIPLRFELLCSIMIPISIKVSLDLMKGLYAKFVDWDWLMYDDETDTPAVSHNVKTLLIKILYQSDITLAIYWLVLLEMCSTSINEDLGQIEYILTDKTGTLTENIMTLKKCFIKTASYDVGKDNDMSTDSPLTQKIVEKVPEVINFLKVMAICNTVVPFKSKRGILSYKSQSQDEEALVQAAARLQMNLITRTDSLLEINFMGDIIKFDVLDILEFTSDRKKMSIIVRDRETGRLQLFAKGADEAILSSLRHGQEVRPTSEAVERYSQLGLRTICLAWRELDEDEYAWWSSTYKEATASLVEREWKVAEVCQRIERKLEILGATGIEDKLQDGVPETIQSLRRAGINFWMLTGDKLTTATQIALSCNLVLPEPQGQVLHVQGGTPEDVASSLDRVLRTLRISGAEPKDIAFIIDGLALEMALTYNREAFTELALLSKTAICCRVTPSQKAQLVQLVKSCEYRTLAIGDGGNDVKMIQDAHVGVGISGREGLQAARASDYSLAKFRFLKRLILVHGRYSYIRTAFMAQYSIYKSLLICFIQILFSFVSGISGTSLFNSFTLMAYNVIYTSVPVMTAVLDKDLSEDTVLKHPEILYFNQAGRLLNPSTFAGWFGRSLFHAIIVFIVTIRTYDQQNSEAEEVAMVAFSGCIWLQAFVVGLEMSSFTYIQILAIAGNVVVFYAVNFAVSTIKIGGMYTIMFRLVVQPSYWFSILLILVLGMGPVLALKYFRFLYRPNGINILQQFEQSQWPSHGQEESRLGRFRKDSFDMTTQSTYSSVYEPLLYDPPRMSSKKGGYSFCGDEPPPSSSMVPLSTHARSKNQ